jgi:hypothetical protein
MICVAAFVAALFTLASAQDVQVSPSVTAIQHVRSGEAESAPSVRPAGVPFCSKKCLYYAGDFDSTDSNANGLFNAADGSTVGQTWIGVKPTKSSTVTGVTFNEFFNSAGVGTNPTPFQTQTGITLGVAGKTVCNTSGTATEAVYGESDFGLIQYSYTVKKLKKSCKIPKPTKKVPSTYVNLLPTFSSTIGYTVNAEDAKPLHHKGWPNDQNDCFFNGTASFGITYATCNSQGIGSNGFSVFSIALTGTTP